MDFIPKSMEELLVYATLLACAALWKVNASSAKRCEERDKESTKRLDLMGQTLMDMQSKTNARALEREKAMVEVSARVADTLDRSTNALEATRDLCIKAIKMLRKYSNNSNNGDEGDSSTALPPLPTPPQALERKRQRTDPRGDETSAIFRE
ncbi:MAG: hypothetical protein ACRCWJ_04845 [Casimicrobium sp.]